MGTRGSVMIIVDNKEKGCYNHSDSYPDGLGEEVIEALKAIDKEKDGWKTFIKNSKKLKLVSEDKKPSKLLQEKYKKFANEGVGSGSVEDWYCLLRELQGAAYITAIMSGEAEHMLDGTNFVKDSLFCEYAYIINLDKMKLEFYEGFQKNPQKGNRFGAQKRGRNGYYPCAKVGEIALEGISKDEMAVEVMTKIYKKSEEEA